MQLNPPVSQGSITAAWIIFLRRNFQEKESQMNGAVGLFLILVCCIPCVDHKAVEWDDGCNFACRMLVWVVCLHKLIWKMLAVARALGNL
jgi:hypothetical protein